MAKRKAKNSNSTRLKTFHQKDDGTINAVIETPMGSRNKFKYDEEMGFYSLAGVRYGAA